MTLFNDIIYVLQIIAIEIINSLLTGSSPFDFVLYL